jgi:hypothetical protein
MGITNFPHGISSFGMPVLPGGIMLPNWFDRTQNNIHWFVDGRTGSDSSNNGKDPDHSLSTIAAAITAARAAINWSATPWGPRHTIHIQPGSYAENLTALPHGCVMIGEGWDLRDGQAGVKIIPASGCPVDVSGVVNTAFYNICFESADTSRAFDSTVINNCLFYNCRFSGAAETTACTAAFYASDCTATKWIGCEFSCATRGMHIVYVDANDKFAHCRIMRCTIEQCTTAGIELSASLVGPSSIVAHNIITGGGQTLATGIKDASSVLDLVDNYITATDAINGYRTVNGNHGNNTALAT